MFCENRSQGAVDSIDKPRAVVLLPTISQPRYHHRIDMLIDAGYQVNVYAFQRAYYATNSYPQSVKVVDLGHVESGRYFMRIPKLLHAAFRIRKHEKSHSNVPAAIYAFGLDMAIVGILAIPRSTPLVYEVGDVLNPLPHTGLTAKTFGMIEKQVLTRCQLLAVTSQGFISDYFSLLNRAIVQKALVIENKLGRDIAAKSSRPLSPQSPSKPIKIGYIGLFKYENCIVSLMDAVSKRKGDFELHFYGDGPTKWIISAYADKYENIRYHGSFVNMRDLSLIYHSVNVSYVVYDNNDANVRMALPNKLYDGPYFGVPLVVSENTLLARRVRELGIGLVVDPRIKGFADQMLDLLTPELLAKLSSAALKLDVCHMVESYDAILPRLVQLSTQI